MLILAVVELSKTSHEFPFGLRCSLIHSCSRNVCHNESNTLSDSSSVSLVRCMVVTLSAFYGNGTKTGSRDDIAIWLELDNWVAVSLNHSAWSIKTVPELAHWTLQVCQSALHCTSALATVTGNITSLIITSTSYTMCLILCKFTYYWVLISYLASSCSIINIQSRQKTGPLLEVHNSCIWWHRKEFRVSNVRYFIWSKTGIVNVTTFKYSLHKFRETI